MSSEDSMGLELSKWTLVVLETGWESGYWRDLGFTERGRPVNEIQYFSCLSKVPDDS